MQKKEAQLLQAQRNEKTEYLIYQIAYAKYHKKNKKALRQAIQQEKKHYNTLKKITKKDVPAFRFKLWWYKLLIFIGGMIFGLKLMEKRAKYFLGIYKKYTKQHPSLKTIIKEEEAQEKTTVNKLIEDRVEYAGSMVLGLNDALVELTGALAGLTFALQNGPLIAVTGVITGFAASLSMAASGYLSSKEEDYASESRDPITSAIYTGFAYIITVLILVSPYFLLTNVYLALATTLTLALLIICTYTYYITTVKDKQFWPQFMEMAVISLGVAIISFGVGIALKAITGVEV